MVVLPCDLSPCESSIFKIMRDSELWPVSNIQALQFVGMTVTRFLHPQQGVAHSASLPLRASTGLMTEQVVNYSLWDLMAG